METHLKDRDRVGVQDAVLLENFTNDNDFVNNLKKRFRENLIYTYIGPVIISVNPYKELNIYDRDDILAYKGKHFFEVPPHVFAIADNAYRSLKDENIEQCILISGESGSGKTEASKKVLHYIAEVENNTDVEQIKDKLLKSNPVLEAFGNAKTTRNDNSSRFGKYMDIVFAFDGRPVGGKILSYLLEKSRVINQAPGERNFHIFYQLLQGGSEAELQILHLTNDLDSYFYLSEGVKGKLSYINDRREYQEVVKALTTLGFDNQTQVDIFSILAAVLTLGNLQFKTDEEIPSETVVDNASLLENVSQLLKCNVQELQNALTHRTVETKTDIVKTPLDKEMAVYARDALAKAVYDRLFEWLVQFINKSLEPKEARSNRAMGILDIYGFEIFQKNSFEQLCINFCNEKLQQLFIELTLKSEQQEYENEGIEWTKIDYFDNTIICDLIEEKHKGIIAFMDEECLRPGDSSDITLLAKLDTELNYHDHYVSHRKADIKLQKNNGER